MLGVWVLAAASIIGSPGGETAEAPRLTLEVLNERAGRGLLSFEDVIGPAAAASSAKPPWRGALLYALPLVGCEGCDIRLKELQALYERVLPRGGSVVVVILGPPERVKQARRLYREAEVAFPIVYDGHELSRLRLHLRGPRSTVVLGATGLPVAAYGAVASGLLRAEQALVATLAEDES